MTKEEAINILNSLKQYYNDKNEDSYVGFDNEDNEALDLAIKALEQTERIHSLHFFFNFLYGLQVKYIIKIFR